MDFQDSLAFRADFNLIDENGAVKTSLYHGSSRRIPRAGERVLLRDGEGNRCWAIVRDVRGVIVVAQLDEETWVSGEETQTVTPRELAGFAVTWSSEPVAD